MMQHKILLSLLLATSLFAKANAPFMDAPTPDKRISPSDSDVILSYHDAIKDAKGAVVNISTSKNIKVSQELEQFMQHPLFREFFGNGMPEGKQGTKQTHSLGSGVIVSPEGYILTNNHVVAGADEIFVSVNGDSEEYKAKLIGADPKTDIAVIKIEGKGFNAITFADSGYVKEGDVVFAIGNPFGVGSTITQGIVSALNKSKVGINQYENFIQTDASINPGNSGGALVDSRGALVGINSAILSRSGDNNGIGFAIPSNMAKNIAANLIQYGKIERGYLGVSIGDLTKDLKGVYKNQQGAVIVDLSKGDAADVAGLKRGDLILRIDNTPIPDATTLKNTVAAYPPNATVKVTFERAQKEQTLSLTLGDQNSIGGKSTDVIDGITLLDLDNEIRQKLRIPSTIEGVMVAGIEPSSTGETFGFYQGDIIVQIENIEIRKVSDVKTALEKLGNDPKRVYVNRNGYIVIIVIENERAK